MLISKKGTRINEMFEEIREVLSIFQDTWSNGNIFETTTDQLQIILRGSRGQFCHMVVRCQFDTAGFWVPYCTNLATQNFNWAGLWFCSLFNFLSQFSIPKMV